MTGKGNQNATKHGAEAGIKRLAEELQDELLETSLAQRNTREALLQRWESLSPREQDVAALTCLGYTNKEIAARLLLSPATVKFYVRQVLGKYKLHSKDELRMLIGHWDWRRWGPINDPKAIYG